MSPPKKAYENLPWYLKKRIKIDAGREDKACWCWTGRFKKARERRRLYPACDNPEIREHIDRRVVENGIPKVLHPFTKTEGDAHRHVYSAVMGCLLEEVPILRRCVNLRCVSPHHVTPSGPTTAQRKRLNPQPEIEPEAALIDVMEVLKRERPRVDGHPDWPQTVEEEFGLRPGSFTQDLVLEYAKYAAENPEDDEDDY